MNDVIVNGVDKLRGSVSDNVLKPTLTGKLFMKLTTSKTSVPFMLHKCWNSSIRPTGLGANWLSYAKIKVFWVKYSSKIGN